MNNRDSDCNKPLAAKYAVVSKVWILINIVYRPRCISVRSIRYRQCMLYADIINTKTALCLVFHPLSVLCCCLPVYPTNRCDQRDNKLTNNKRSNPPTVGVTNYRWSLPPLSLMIVTVTPPPPPPPTPLPHLLLFITDSSPTPPTTTPPPTPPPSVDRYRPIDTTTTTTTATTTDALTHCPDSLFWSSFTPG